MQPDEAQGQSESFPAADAAADGPQLDADPTAFAAFDPEIASQFVALGEEFGRERSKQAIFKGIYAPVGLSSAAVGCGFLGGIYLVGAAVLYGTAIVWLVRVWRLISRATLLTKPERRKAYRRLEFAGALIVVAGIILAALAVL